MLLIPIIVTCNTVVLVIIFYFGSLNWSNNFLCIYIKCYLSVFIISLNLFSVANFTYLFTGVSYYNHFLFDIKLTGVSFVMLNIVVVISSAVILNSIDYLTVIESSIFLLYIMMFQLSMVIFILSHDLIITFINWDLIGLTSYLLINFWSDKTNCGIKAAIYNKVGDCFFLLVIATVYSVFSLINYSIAILPTTLFSFFVTLIIHFIGSCGVGAAGGLFIGSFFTISILIYYSKSAQLPFSSWLLNAMSAPTPISALLHSSTMVIAGVYLAIVFDSTVILFIDLFDFFFVLLLITPVYSLLWSLIRALCLSDIKSIIACSTISQISYLFLSLLFSPVVCLFHITVHAMFKSLLFLLAGSIIHYNLNYQSIYKIKVNNSFILIMFVLGFLALIFSLSKEGIMLNYTELLSTGFVFIIGFGGGIITSIYGLKLYIYLVR
jgi:NADH-quinone oxidoreductase subunit L